MAKIDVLNLKGEKVKDLTLKESVWNTEINEVVMRDAIILAQASLRQGTASTKTRTEVSGGGRKPYKQKGTGNARQGSTRSPQWTGGGVVFAPTPRDYSFKLNKKEKRKALLSVLSAKVTDSKFLVLDTLELAEIKTKNMIKVLDNLKVAKAIVVLPEKNDNVYLSTRNLPTVTTTFVNTLNVFDLLKYDTVITTKAAVEKIEEVYV